MLCTRAGFADGVVNVVTASLQGTPDIGKKLCEDPRIKKLSFTGSTRVGLVASSPVRQLTEPGRQDSYGSMFDYSQKVDHGIGWKWRLPSIRGRRSREGSKW
jgi:hypothetical protein